MRVAIVGSRAFEPESVVRQFVRSLVPGTVVVSGGARGPDTWAVEEALLAGLDTHVILPDWRLGRGAGLVRNAEIVRQADRVVAFWDGQSRGTADTIARARRAGKPTYVRTPGGLVRHNWPEPPYPA